MTASAPAGPDASDILRLIEEWTAWPLETVSKETQRKYDRLIRDVWSPLCRQHRVDPLHAPPSMIFTLFESARTGDLRRFGQGNKRRGPVSPGYLDAILSAVRYAYNDQLNPSPLAAFSPSELEQMRTGYRDRVGQAGSETAPVMTAGDLGRLCFAPPFSTRQEGAAVVVGLLSLDFGVTLDEIGSLQEHHVERGSDHLVLAFASRQVTLRCDHRLDEGIVPVCTACLVEHFVNLEPVAGTADLALFAGRSDHHVLSAGLREWLYSSLYRLVAKLPSLLLAGPRGAKRVQYVEVISPRLRVGTRQALVVGSMPRLRGQLLAQTVLKLIACRGLSCGEIVERLRVAHVRYRVVPGVEPSLQLQLPRTIRARRQDVDWVTVIPQMNPLVCPVVAMKQWLLVREAVVGQPLPPDAHIFVASSGWCDVSTAGITVQAARVLLLKLQRTAGMALNLYCWESVQKLHVATLIAQNVSEVDLYKTLRRKKVKHVQRQIAALAPTAGDVARTVAAPQGDQ